MTAASWIVALGHYLPEREVTNSELANFLAVDPEGIAKRTGIRSRRWASGGVYTSDLAVAACRDALASGDVDPAQVDCLIAATQSPDHNAPGLAMLTQAKLGLKGVPCFDIRANCSGFLYSLQIARAFIACRMYRRILVAGAELQSHGLGRTPAHAHTTPLFGDGAAAALLSCEPTSDLSLAIRWVKVHADGADADRLRHRMYDVSLEPPWDIRQLDEDPERVLYPEMDGEYVFRRAVRTMVEMTHASLRETGLTLADISYYLPHQANNNINRTVAAILGIPPQKMLSNIDRVGNTSGASIPILLSETAKAGRIRSQDRILCVAFGAGFTWGAAVLEAGR